MADKEKREAAEAPLTRDQRYALECKRIADRTARTVAISEAAGRFAWPAGVVATAGLVAYFAYAAVRDNPGRSSGVAFSLVSNVTVNTGVIALLALAVGVGWVKVWRLQMRLEAVVAGRQDTPKGTAQPPDPGPGKG